MTDHTDIVERLDACADDPMWAAHCEMSKATARKAAAEITRLRAEAEALRKALEWYAGRAVPSQHPDSIGHCDDGHFARKTLAALDATKGTT